MLTIKVECSAGDDIRDAIEEMCILASRTGCLVSASLNSVTTMAKPGADPRDLYQKWCAELESKAGFYKVCCAQPIEIERNQPWDAPRLQLGKSEPR